MSFSGIVGGNGFVCGLRSPFSSSNSTIMVCWRFSSDSLTNWYYKRIYRGPALSDFQAGNSHICGLVSSPSSLECWQWPEYKSNTNPNFSRIAVGESFACGLSEFGQIACLGNNSNIVDQKPDGNYSEIAAGFRHACAVDSLNGKLECWGEMVGERPDEIVSSLALGESRSCALRVNGTVVCWGQNNFSVPEALRADYFTTIHAKKDIFCGVLSSNYSLICWGNDNFQSNSILFNNVMPGPCESKCNCGALPGYGEFCNQGYICKPCTAISQTLPPSLPPVSPPCLPPQGSSGGGSDKRKVAFIVVGAVGSLSLASIGCFLLFLYCKGRVCKIHDSGRLDEIENGLSNRSQPPPQPPVLEKRLSQLASIGNGCHLEEFSLQKLLEATNNFSEEQKIGTGSYGVVYHGKLDEKEVAIKRAEISAASSYAYGTKWQVDKDSAFINELEFLSRLNHKNLVRLLGYCEENNERILVYEYMGNGTLHDHLHKLPSSPLMSWPSRIKTALDAARGIEYLHVYAQPPVIHRDIKSSNILLDVDWTAKVSDFGLSLMGPDDEQAHLSLVAAGTMGYMDPEYYMLQQLTTKSDVYSFGVVLLELLSGRKAIHKNENGIPRNVVDFVVPYIIQDEIHRVLDKKVPPPTPVEIEGVAYVGYLAADCVTLEGRDRPSMTEIVNSLERAWTACLVHPTLSQSTSNSSTETILVGR